MKRLFTIILFLLTSLATPSAYLKVTYIPVSPAVNYYDALIKAIVAIESSGDTWALNINEQACGAFQIRPIRVKHYNKLRGTDYKTWNFFDYDLSREMFLYYARGKSYQKAARDWNGKWEFTKEYWKKVKSRL